MTAAAHRPRLSALAGVIGLAIGLGGCISSGVSDLTGVVASYSPFSSAPGETKKISLLVASTHEKANLGQATFSEIIATVPPGHSPGVIERPVVTMESPLRHVTLGKPRPLSGQGLQASVSRRLAGRQGMSRDVLVFVHGFNNSLEDAAYRLTQIVADTNFAGATILFAWPSRASMFSYVSDKDGATASRDALEKLLRDLGANPDVGRVHVLAHSMGSWLAMESLRQAAIGGDGSLGGKIGAVMLAAPDLDLDVFRGQIARIGRGDNISLFVASDDRALMISSRLAGLRARVGALDLSNREQRDEIASLGVRVYDLTGIGSSDYMRHGAFAEAPQIVQVIGARLKEPKITEGVATASAATSGPTTPSLGPVAAPGTVSQEALAPVTPIAAETQQAPPASTTVQ
ncbi:alpha/beta hydrolase [Terrarubrum flagellatum]|uniref:alpha/beta hydrolase n=1 Tax=Terrirubrum flagellatum TaxID=2895980 RepID=UPI0031454173